VTAMRSLLAAVAALAAVLAQPAAASQKPQTLWSPPHTTIAAFTQDGQTIAWVGSHAKGCNTVHLQSLANGIGYDLPSQSAPNVTCKFVWSRDEPVDLALAGVRALWSLPQESPLSLDYLLGAGVSPTDRAERRFVEVAHNARGVGQWLGGVAGSGTTLTYALTTVDWDDEAGCLAGTGPCTLTKTGGGVYVVRGRQPVRVRGALAAVEVATAAGNIAYVPTGRLDKNGRPRPSADLPIEIVDAASGQRVASVVPQGVPIAIALSAHVLATLERTPLGLRLAWYDATTGHARGSIPVPETTTPWLSASDQLIVFRVGRSIRGVSVTTHRSRLLTRAAATPVGLSLEGGRLAWAENRKGVSRIRAVYVSGRG
jgi:hypothetical protein